MLSHRIRPVSEILAPHVEHLWVVRGYLPGALAQHDSARRRDGVDRESRRSAEALCAG